MPPRRPTTTRPVNVAQMVDQLERINSTVLHTGMTMQPRFMLGTIRGPVQTAQQAISFATQPGNDLGGMTPDYVLTTNTSPDFTRLVHAITTAAQRDRFR